MTKKNKEKKRKEELTERKVASNQCKSVSRSWWSMDDGEVSRGRLTSGIKHTADEIKLHIVPRFKNTTTRSYDSNKPVRRSVGTTYASCICIFKSKLFNTDNKLFY